MWISCNTVQPEERTYGIGCVCKNELITESLIMIHVGYTTQ